MTLPPLSTPAFIGLIVAALVFALATGRAWSRWRVRRWCREQDYELLEFRGAWFFEGPGAWLRSENQAAYRVRVRDRRGLIRGGYVVFGSYWLPLSRKVRVEWEETEEGAGPGDPPEI